VAATARLLVVGERRMAIENQHAGSAWYDASRADFVAQASEHVAGVLASAASCQGWSIEPEQAEEWRASVELLQRRLRGPHGERIAALRSALARPDARAVTDIILEYDFRRRGLRIDCVLLAPGAILVLEFKRGKPGAAARDQVMAYCTSLLEFHEETRRLADAGSVLVPIVVRTRGALPYDQVAEGGRSAPMSGVAGWPATRSRTTKPISSCGRWRTPTRTAQS